MSKSFTQAPRPKLDDTQINSFVQGGAGHDTHVQQKPNKALPKDKLKRLSIDLDEELHWRFKIACARAKLKMTSELLEFVELRTAELEAKLDKERSF